ncbi:MAG: hypothetical protein WDZ37_05455 [Solirubrobacterales bacterium]
MTLLAIAPVASAATDDVYVSEPFASSPDVGAVVRVDTSGTQSLLAQQGNLPTVQVNQIAFEPPGNLLVAVGNGTVVRVNKDSGAQSILAQGGLLNSTFGVAVGPTGDAFVTDSDKVFKITPAGAVSLFEDDPLLAGARGLTVAPNGDVFVVVVTTPGIVKISGGTASSFSVNGAVTYLNPQAVARDSAGNFYVANRGGQNILKVGPAGGAPADYIPATNPTINEPVAVAVDRLDNLVVADLDVTADNNPGVVKFDAAKTASIVTTNGELQDERGVTTDTTLPSAATNPPDKSVTTTVTAKKTQKALKQKGLIIDVTCPQEACTATVAGTLTVPKVSTAKNYKLKQVSKSLTAGRKVAIKLKFTKKVIKAVRRALRARKKVRAKVTVSARDAAGNSSSTSLKIKIKK